MEIPEAVRTLERDLRAIFGARLQSLVAYRPSSEVGMPTLAMVDALTVDDLRACAGQVAEWHDAGLATPLLLAAHEFGRSLDAFPIEFGAILADHVVVAGVSPFEGLRVDPAHLRHACEIQARSHLLHLREGFVETRGRGDQLADLILRSSAPFAALLISVARLDGNDPPDLQAAVSIVHRVLGLTGSALSEIVTLSRRTLTSDTARLLFPAYLEAAERLTSHVDRWSAR